MHFFLVQPMRYRQSFPRHLFQISDYSIMSEQNLDKHQPLMDASQTTVDSST